MSDKLAELCTKFVTDPYLTIGDFCSSNQFEPHHIDILLSSEYFSDRAAVYRHIQKLSFDQIARGLNDESNTVRHVAYKHHCCTEAHKVAYHLKCGSNGS